MRETPNNKNKTNTQETHPSIWTVFWCEVGSYSSKYCRLKIKHEFYYYWKNCGRFGKQITRTTTTCHKNDPNSKQTYVDECFGFHNYNYNNNTGGSFCLSNKILLCKLAFLRPWNCLTINKRGHCILSSRKRIARKSNGFQQPKRECCCIIGSNYRMKKRILTVKSLR